MNLHSIAAWRAANHGVDAASQRPSSITRRQFAGAAAGTAVLGGALGSSLFRPALADTRASFAPVPIPGGSPYDGLNGMFHFFGPNSIDPIDAEPSTITNLNGFVGLAYIDGTVTQTNTQTGEALRLPTIHSDMRFMQGEFRGADGRIHHGSFALV
jgi:hypothetical protein